MEAYTEHLAPSVTGEPAERLRVEQQAALELETERAISGRVAPRERPDDDHLIAEIAAREHRFRWALGIADMLAAILAIVACVNLLGDDSLRPMGLLVIPLVVLAAKVHGLYDRDDLVIHKSTLDEVPRLFQLATVYGISAWLLDGLIVDGMLSKVQLLGLAGVLFVNLVAGRVIARAIAGRISDRERCLVIGDADVHARLKSKFDSLRNVDLVGFIPIEQVNANALLSLAQERGIHRAIIAPADAGTREASLNLVRVAKASGLRVSVIPGALEVVGSAVVFDDIAGMTILGVRRFGLTRSSALLKRAFDLAGAMIALIVFAPILAIASVAIKLTSPGPVFFRQTRVGRDGRRFRIYKLRTMVNGADTMRTELRDLNEVEGGLFKIAADPRITRVGLFLRRTCIDELPQLFNVIRGEMSLVGPRPLVEDEDELITGLDRRRLQLTPGITGPWQVLGSSRIPLHEMVKIDYVYVAGWSLWSDVKLLLRTVRVVVGARGL